jgi:hypothetical protein
VSGTASGASYAGGSSWTSVVTKPVPSAVPSAIKGGIQWLSGEPAASSVASEPGRSRPNEIRNLGNLVPMHQLPSSKVPPTAAIAATMQQPSTLSSSAAPTHPPTLAAGPSQQQPQQQQPTPQPHQPHRK